MQREAWLARELSRYLEAGEAGTPQERGRRSGELCTAIAHLLAELMVGQPDWDSRYTWLDGIRPVNITRPFPAGLRLVGGAYVVNGDRWKLQPIHADLRSSPRSSAIYFAAPDSAVDYEPGNEGRFVIPADPFDWPYRFTVRLPPWLPMPQVQRLLADLRSSEWPMAASAATELRSVPGAEVTQALAAALDAANTAVTVAAAEALILRDDWRAVNLMWNALTTLEDDITDQVWSVVGTHAGHRVAQELERRHKALR